MVAMYHPETLLELQATIMAATKVPKTSAEVSDDNRAAVTEMLQTLGVKSPEEAWQLPSATFYERMLESGRKRAIAAGLTEGARVAGSAAARFVSAMQYRCCCERK